MGDLILTTYSEVVGDSYNEFGKSLYVRRTRRIENMTKTHRFSRFAYTREEEYIKIDAAEYTPKVLAALSHTNFKGRLIPGGPGTFLLEQTTSGCKPFPPKEHKSYSTLVGQFLWLSNV